MFEEIRHPPTSFSHCPATSQLTPDALAALPPLEQIVILRRDLAEMWRAHNHNTHVICLLVAENARLRSVVQGAV